MDLNIYRQNLDKVIKESAPPTLETLLALCPHVSEASVRELITRSQYANDLVEFAIPSVLIANSYHVCGIAPPRKCSSFLTYCRHRRTPDSYSDGKARLAFPEARSPMFISEALEFARANWGEQLVTDNWQSVLKYNLYQPGTSPDGRNDSRLVCEVGVALSRLASDILSDDTRPVADQLDDAVLRVSHWLCEDREMAGGRQFCELNNCACSGCNLDLAACKVRGIDWCFRLEAPLPVPAKVIAYLKDIGIVFQSKS